MSCIDGGARYPPSPIFVVFVVNRGDNPLIKVCKKILGKIFGKKVNPPNIAENVKKNFGKFFGKRGSSIIFVNINKIKCLWKKRYVKSVR